MSARPHWARTIGEAWQSSVHGILRCGSLLIEAKADLQHGEFLAMIATDLPFGERTAQRLMKVALHPVLSNPTHVSLLPPSWRTLYQIAQLPVARVAALVEQGRIHPEMQERDISQQVKVERRAERERELAERTIAAAQVLGHKLYNVILADPPWRFEPYSRESGMDRAADNHYPTMETAAIAAMKVPAADDCALFLWATIPMLPEALVVMTAWGFTYRSSAVWIKDRLGPGYWFREKHELLLVGTRGNVPAPAPGEQYESVIDAPRLEHSVKPFAVYEMIEEMFPTAARLEMFARERFDGWDQWGNEVRDAAD